MRIADVREELVRHRWKKYPTRSLEQITHIILHHSATSGGKPQSFAYFHVNFYGWPGIGYHYVISKDGLIFKTNSLTTVSFHTRGLNECGIGICLVGNYNIDFPSSAQLSALGELLDILVRYLPRVKVILHRQAPLAKTACPGKNVTLELVKELMELRRNGRKLQSS